MLQGQDQGERPMSFLAGEGEMQRRIREFDWRGHRIGEPESWPQSLRSALGICLNSAFPTAIYWGPELCLLYNDAWSTIPGPRHPACLGKPGKEVWSDIWHIIEPQFRQVIATGEGVFVDDQFLPMRRFGYEEETYWSYSFTPILGADGRIEGIFNSGYETTAKVLRQRASGFLLRLSDRLRGAQDTEQILSAATSELGDHLGAIRVGLRESDPLSGPFPVKAEWTREGDTAVPYSVPWQDLGIIADSLSAGSVVRIGDSEHLPEREAALLAKIGIGSLLAVPWHRSGALQAVLFVHRKEPAQWQDSEVEIVEQVLSRVVQAIDTDRARQRENTLLHEIDHRARNMLGVAQALVRMLRVEDVEVYRESLLDRLGSMGNTLRLLSDANWEGATLRSLLESELAPFLSGDVRLEGPSIHLQPELVQPIAMVLHELVTNAVKYGALSGEGGQLAISWRIEGGHILAIDWQERKPEGLVQQKVSSTGFGTKLLKITIEQQLDGRITQTFDQGNLHCQIEMSLDLDEG